jgi:hypothetical protein
MIIFCNVQELIENFYNRNSYKVLQVVIHNLIHMMSMGDHVP